MASQTLDAQNPESTVPNASIPRCPDPREVLDDDRRRTILAMIASGSSRRAAARFVGCAASTITRTAQRDPDFGLQLAQALDRIQRHCLGLLLTAAEHGQWRAAAWLLERTNPDDFARRPPNTFTPDDVAALVLQFVAALARHIPADQVDQLRDIADAWIEDNLETPAPPRQASPDVPVPPNADPASAPCAPSQPTCQPLTSEPVCQAPVVGSQPGSQPPLSIPQPTCASSDSEPQGSADIRPLGKLDRKAARRDRRHRRAQARRAAAQRA